jgi:very-short-patch-repair endonuclease
MKSTKEAQYLAYFLEKLGWDPILEYYDGHKHIDIAILKAKTYLEIDGMQHNVSLRQAKSDQIRELYSLKDGFITHRIPNNLIRYDITETLIYLNQFLHERMDQLNS